MELNKKVQINIVDVENPGKFWFRTVVEEKKIQDALHQYEQENHKNRNFLPKIHDLVIVRLLNKVSVVRVEKVMNENKIAISFLESGKKRIVQRSEVMQLCDESLSEAVRNSILMGKLSDISPIEAMLNERLETEFKRSNKWSTMSAEIIRNHMNRARGVFFQATSLNGSCYSGELTFEINCAQMLIDAKLACATRLENGYENEYENGYANGYEKGYENRHENGYTNGFDHNGNSNVSQEEYEDEQLSEIIDDDSDVRPVISLASHCSAKKANGKAEQLCTPDEDEKSKNSKSNLSAVSGSVEMPVHSSENLEQWSSSSSDKSNDNTFYGNIVPPKERIDVVSNIIYQKFDHRLTPITEYTVEEDDISSLGSDSEIPAYMLQDSESEDDGKQYEYQWSPEKERERSIEASQVLKTQMIEALLKDAALPTREPFTFCRPDNISSELLCEDYLETLLQHNKLYPAQGSVWEYIAIATPTILIGNTDYYPHLLYLPPIISMIRMQKRLCQWDKDKKVIIFASNCKEAAVIRRLCYAFLDNSVYSDAEDYFLAFDERRYNNCDIYISLMNRLCQNTKENLPTDAYYIVLNNVESIGKEIRKEIVQMVLDSNLKFLITSRYNVDELRACIDGIPNICLSFDSYFDAFHMSGAKAPRYTELIESNKKYTKLKTLIGDMYKVVVVCNHEKDARDLSIVLKNEHEIETVVNQKPKKGTRVLICSDDQLDGVTETANHIIHFDLPNDFNTFSRRYSVLKSHFKFQDNNNIAKEPTSSILISNAQFLNNNALLLHLLYRNGLYITVKNEKSLNTSARFMNDEAALCIDTPLSFVNFNHLIECRNRHSFKDVEDCSESVFTDPKECQLEILRVLSPAWISVRITDYKDVGSTDWLEYHSCRSFDEFNTAFEQFYATAFEPIQNPSELAHKMLYVLRDGDKFSRCRIMVNKIDGENIPVRLVDLGEIRTVNFANIGRLNERHTDFPWQSIDLCVLGFIPWSRSGWTEQDTNIASDILSETFGKRRYKTIIQCKIGRELVFAFNLFKSNDEPQNHLNTYVNLIVQKGIAIRSTSGLQSLFQHAMDVKLLTIDQWNRIKNFLL